MNAEILCVGTELLLGRVTNTNAAYLAKELARLGIGCYWQTVVGDNQGRMEQAVSLALSRADIVILTGGLGPTYDDVTKEVVAEHFGKKMELHQPSWEMLQKRFVTMNRPMTENNKKQAYMPVGARVFPNDRGTANGLAIGENNKFAILLPGPPRELEAMFQQQVVPYLMQFSGQVLRSHSVHMFGIGESQLEQELHDYMLSLTNPTLAPYASGGEVMLQVTARGDTPEQAEECLTPVLTTILTDYKDYIYGVDVGDLQTALVQALQKQNKTIATAESCTGGMVSERITQVSGASGVFGYGVCTYSNEAKQELLGVSPTTLEKHGAVSQQVATEMAKGIRQKAGVDIGISVTGIAGPTGGTPQKPVGLVYVGVSTTKGDFAKKLMLARNDGALREHIRYSASSHALYTALEVLTTLNGYEV